MTCYLPPCSRPAHHYLLHRHGSGTPLLGRYRGHVWSEEGRAETIRLAVDTSFTAIGTRTTSVLKDLEHRNVGLAGNNLELAGNVKPELQATAIPSLDLANKS